MSMTPPLNAIDLAAVPLAAPTLSSVNLTASGGSTPALNSIDLTSLPAFAPDLGAIDLAALEGAPPPAERVYGEGRATLSFHVAGSATGFVMGAGAASLPFSVAGVGNRPNSGAVELTLLSSGLAIHGFAGAGTASLSLSGTGKGYQDWLSLIPPLQLQEVYRLVITGEPDGLSDLLIGGISSWQATSQAGGRASYVQAVIPAANDLIAGITARQGGELIIQKGYKLEGGSARYEEIQRSRFDMIRPDRGGRALTVTVSGYISGKTESSGFRELKGVRSISAQNGKRRVRCEIDLFLQPGMTVDAVGEEFTAGYINYYVNQADKFCEVGER